MSNNNKRKPDMILVASEIPATKEDPFEKSVRVGAAWLNEDKGTISIALDNFVVLKGRPYAYISLVLVKNREVHGS